MMKCKIVVDGYYVGVEYFTANEIRGLNNEPGITITIINE